MNKAKERMKELLNKNELEQLPELIEEYEAEFPYDLELYSIKGTYYFLIGKLEEAEKQLLAGYQINKYNFDIIFNLALVFEAQEKYIDAAQFYTIIKFYLFNDFVDATVIENKQALTDITAEKLQLMEEQINTQANKIFAEYNQTIKEEFLKKFKSFSIHENNIFHYNAISHYCSTSKVYSSRKLIYDDSYYVAPYTRTGRNIDTTLESAQIELIKTLEYSEENQTQGQYLIQEESLVPIVLKSENTTNPFEYLYLNYKNKKIKLNQTPNQIYYYRLDSDFTIENKDYIIGKPIPLKQNSQKKKLILTIFIDGLAQSILDEYGFENLMPNTANYFKDSIICRNAYTTSDWTYPSMASYFTGLYPANHKLYHGRICTILPENTITLGEMIQQAGYPATKIDGCWRTSPDSGHSRGFWHQIYSIYSENMSAPDVIAKGIDQIDMLKETNQYLYLRFGELHDIADKYKLSPDLQARITTVDKQDEFNDISTSVLIEKDKYKEKRYIEQIKYIDKYLGILFDHIKETIGDDVIVTLFSDHGQGFLLNNDDFFLADKRSKVPLMIKGASKEKTYCDDYISAVDYLHILNKIADLNIDLGEKDGSLPVFFGGEKEKDYIITESIHEDRYYHIALRNKDYYFTFKTAEKADNDGRVSFENYETKLMNPKGEVIDNKEMEDYFTKEVFDHMKEFIIY